MAKNLKQEEKESPTEETELGLYQSSLKNKLNILGNGFSIILILLGLFLLVNGLFGIVNKDGVGEAIPTDNTFDVNSDIGFDEAIQVEEEGSIGSIDEGISTSKVQAGTSSAIIKATETKNQIEKTHRWRATDYEKGDIGIGEYEVQLGDTLWEIAEAVYGDGFMWTKILNSNKGSIGFLPDGSQALIDVGQVLSIMKS